MSETSRRGTPPGQAGFTMVELLVVVAIIATMAAVALPSIGRYYRNFQIRAAADQVAGEVTTARLKAIMKNTNYGVAFVVVNSTQYRYVLEDDVTPDTTTGMVSTTRISLATMINDSSQAGTLRTLPPGVTFATSCSGFTATDSGFRFNRLGSWCDPTGTSEPCPAFPSGVGTTLVENSSANGGGKICLVHSFTGLKRVVSVGTGGRVMTAVTN